MIHERLQIFAETDKNELQRLVNDFINGGTRKIKDISFQTTFIGDAYRNTVEYSAFIQYVVTV